MNANLQRMAAWARGLALACLTVVLAGCATHEIGGPSYGYYERPIGHDGPGYGPSYGGPPGYGPPVVRSGPRRGYDYFPAYEVYYDRVRNEYIYVEQNRWVRRPQPRGFDLNVLFSSPSVHLEFRDSPARRHREVVRTYPRHWRGSGRYDPRFDRRW